MKYSDFERGFIFQLDGVIYTETDNPSNNGNFKATDDGGKLHHFNILDVIRYSEYQHPEQDKSGRKICRKCGAIITNGINGAQMLEVCFTCNGGAPRYPKPSSAARTTYDADEANAAEARARSINFDYD